MLKSAKRLLGSKKSKSKGAKIKLKIKTKSPEAMAGIVRKLARGAFKVNGE